MATAQIDQGLKKLLSGNLGSEVGTKVYAGIAPEDARPPFVTYQRVGGFKIGDINGPSGLARTTFQIDVWSGDYAQSRTVANAIRLILDGFSGTVTIDADEVVIGGVSFQDERDFIEDQSDPKLYQSSVDYLFKYQEDI